MMTPRLDVFLKGGLGNQLIQMAYADSLHVRTGINVRINPILLHPFFSRLRSISRRDHAFSSVPTLNEVLSPPMQGVSLLRLCLAHLSSAVVSDQYTDSQIIDKILQTKAQPWLGLIGYFQRRQAFGGTAERFWSDFKNQLLQHYLLRPFPRGQVVAHIRLGDYLWPENQRMFAKYPLSKQLHAAREWSESLGGSEPIHLVTDDPVNLQRLLGENMSKSFIIYQGADAEDDFLFLAKHRHIIGSNSTFSLTSAKLASELWNEPHVLKLPNRWFVNNALDAAINEELSNCSFISYTDV